MIQVVTDDMTLDHLDDTESNYQLSLLARTARKFQLALSDSEGVNLKSIEIKFGDTKTEEMTINLLTME